MRIIALTSLALCFPFVIGAPLANTLSENGIGLRGSVPIEARAEGSNTRKLGGKSLKSDSTLRFEAAFPAVNNLKSSQNSIPSNSPLKRIQKHQDDDYRSSYYEKIDNGGAYGEDYGVDYLDYQDDGAE